MEARGDTKNALRKKNIIAAYESKLGKQITLAYYERASGIREQQLITVMNVLKRELAPRKLAQIRKCIMQETP